VYVNSDRAMYVGPSMVQSLSLSKTVLGKYSRTLQVNKNGWVSLCIEHVSFNMYFDLHLSIYVFGLCLLFRF